jgi:transposase
MTRQQKTDKRDAEPMVKLLVEGRFPRIGVAAAADRDGRQLLVNGHQLVQWPTQVKNQLQFLALNQGLQLKWRLWTRSGRQKLEALRLDRYAAQGRTTLLRLLDQLEQQIASLDTAVLCEAQARPDAVRRMTHPGVGRVSSWAWVVTLGPVERFAGARPVASYFGRIARERCSGGQQRLGGISKQGNSFVGYLLVQGGHSAARLHPEWKRFYGPCKHTHGHVGVAKVAVARKLAVRLYCMLRDGIS